ncbi:MAG: 5-(carboxyamino)imidazole ribonucleotide mutase [Kiritimatiellia bacterium]|jgi:5-(carboxyamino)imidazole ribonucleotide mutase
METKPLVGIVMGSKSDWPALQKAVETLDDFGIPREVRVISAHRSPDIAADYAGSARERGLQVILAAAGGAAHLGGILAAHTTLPVVGVPVAGGALNGIDALLATVQMPSGIPVATVALGSAGPTNAALFAIQVLALSRPELREKLCAYKADLRRKVVEADAELQAELAK